MSKNSKKFPNVRRPQMHRPELLPTVDTSFYTAATVRTREWRSAQIILVGCGGIGAYVADNLGRLMRTIYEAESGVHLTLVDPDIVKEENVRRQRFCDAEVGIPKAEALHRRYTGAWGLNCSHHIGEFDESLIIGSDITVLVGCVDNARARESLDEVLESNRGSRLQFWWLDCSNGAGKTGHVGRAVLGNARSYEELRGAFPDPKTCVALPSPALQFRDLLVPRPEELDGSGLSCAELAERGEQPPDINARVAVEGVITLRQLLVTRDLKSFQVEVNTQARSQSATYVTPEEVARVISKPISFVRGYDPAAAA